MRQLKILLFLFLTARRVNSIGIQMILFPQETDFPNAKLPKIREGETKCVLTDFNDLSPVREVIEGKPESHLTVFVNDTADKIEKGLINAKNICWGFGGPFECKEDTDDKSIYTCQCATSGNLAELKLIKNNQNCRSQAQGLCMAHVHGSYCVNPLQCDTTERDPMRFDNSFNGRCMSQDDDMDNNNDAKALEANVETNGASPLTISHLLYLPFVFLLQILQ